MPLVQIFDPPMCCSTGVCGPRVDTTLTQFAADLEWLKKQGVEVERVNLAHAPDRFAQHEVVRDALQKRGESCLPLILVECEIVAEGRYPTREELAVLAAVPTTGSDTRGVKNMLKVVPCCGPNADGAAGKCC